MSSHDRRSAGRRRAWGRGPIILRFEPLEKRTIAPLFFRWKEAVPARDVARVLGKAVGSIYFAANRTDQLLALLAGSPKKSQESAGGFFWGYDRGHEYRISGFCEKATGPFDLPVP